MRRALLLLTLLLLSNSAFAQLNCSGGIFGCSPSVTVNTSNIFTSLAIGQALTANTVMSVYGTVTGSGTSGFGLDFEPTVNAGATGLNAIGMTVTPTLASAASGTNGLIMSSRYAPTYIDNGATVTNFANVDIAATALNAHVTTGSAIRIAAPTSAGTNWAINVTSGGSTFPSLNTSTLQDTNGNVFLASAATASAVDSVTITNAATANPATVTIAASGTDTNINTALNAKGSGMVTHSTYMQATSNRVALTADWTCGTSGTVASCTAATIIGSGGGVPLTFTLPLQSQPWHWQCNGVVGQATAATANSWNFLTATTGATNVTASYSMNTAATAMTGGATTDQSSTTTTVVIGPTWTLGGTATKMPFHIEGTVEGAAAAGTVLSLQLVAPTAADLVTIYRGANCTVGL